MADDGKKNEMNEFITKISETITKKKVQSLCRKILKKCSFKSAGDLENVTELAYWLYVYGYCDEAMSVCDLLKDTEFTGNYTLWNKTDDALCLKARILREQGNPEEREKLIEKVNEHRDPELYKNLIGWYRETLNQNIASNTGLLKKSSWMMTKLRAAVRYREAGRFPIPDEEFEKDISELTDALKAVK